MIINPPYKTGDSVSIKLSSGEELIGRFESQDSNVITIAKPVALMPSPEGMALGPFMMGAMKASVYTLNTDLVVTMVKTDEDLARQYIESTTGLKL